MNPGPTLKNSLINVEDSILVLIDIQDYFLNKYDNAKTQSLIAKVVWLLQVAKHLEVPVVAMGEDLEHTGDLNHVIKGALPLETKIHNKDSFGLTYNEDIRTALNSIGRKTAILVGMETDVCVAQSALGLLEEGYQVVVLKDAITTTEWDEEIGLSRMREAGVVITSVKALYFEWLRSASKLMELKKLAPELTGELQPSDLVL